ncbi:MAG: hypothetical protein MJ051_02070 [Akkermansia sp.]|nr:hypothetical protein [Akkermansia sp.]
MKYLLLLALSLPMCSAPSAVSATPAAPAGVAMPASDLLAESTVVAEYLGVQEIPCRFMTALCPDKCDHATTVANFRVLSVEHYAKLGEYGDPKPEEGDILPVDIRRPAPGQVALPALAAGDKVRLTIQHRYTKGNVQEPIRPVTKAEAL